MKTVRVVAAVIKAINENGEPIIFATQRGYGDFKDGWEFPGGKIEEGETPQEALKREIMEELDTEISVGELINTVEYDYPTFHLSMDCFWCEVVKGDFVLKEHEAAKWVTKEQLNSVEWLPADIKLVENIIQAVCRDILCFAMQTLKDEFIVAHVHDELILECSMDTAVEEICEKMGRTPPWIPGLLLRADGYECSYYMKD